jgi:CubicO group peptidase (beta-lactamase class C family)
MEKRRMDLKKLGIVLEEIFYRWEVPGMAVGIVQAGEVVFSNTWGVIRQDAQAPVTQDTLFCVASVSKPFVAAAVMQLVERGLVDLDAPLVQYLSDFSLDDERSRQITIRQMLSHTSGMPDEDEFAYWELYSHPEYDAGARERYLDKLEVKKLVANPGECFQYSNIAYNVLGELIAKVSAKPFEDYMETHILKPAGMSRSTFRMPELSDDSLAMPHLRVPEMIISPVYPYHRADAPGNGLHSSLTELCRWAILCLNRGSFQGQRVLEPASFYEMWKPVAEQGGVSISELAGLGCFLGHYRRERTVVHVGSHAGLTACLIILPDQARAAVMMLNEESQAISRTLGAVLNVMLDREPRVGAVSWLIPVCQAIELVGVTAAYDTYNILRKNGHQEYFLDASSLVTLARQMMLVGKIEQAIEVLALNIHVFPDFPDSYIYLGLAYLESNNRAKARESLVMALCLVPEDTRARDLLAMLDQNIEIQGVFL